MIKYYPVNLALEDKKCVIAGAGTIAERKIKRLLECGAKILVISPEITVGLKKLAKKKEIIFKRRKVGLKDLNDAYLVISATSDRKLNSVVSSYCRKRNILVNVVDSPRECNFILPSILRRGALTISISTDGISPALAKKIRWDLEQKFGAEYSKLLHIMEEIRPLALKKIKDLESRKRFFKKILQPEILNLLRKNKGRQVKSEIQSILVASSSPRDEAEGNRGK